MAWTLRRPAARAVLLDRHGRIFLMRASDPIDPHKPPWWEIPGGGLDPGEDFAECARRELWEEAGFADVEVGPCIWTQHVEFDFAGIHFDSHERIHVAWCPDGGEWDPQHLEALEAAASRMPVGGRWKSCWPLMRRCCRRGCGSFCLM